MEGRTRLHIRLYGFYRRGRRHSLRLCKREPFPYRLSARQRGRKQRQDISRELRSAVKGRGAEGGSAVQGAVFQTAFGRFRRYRRQSFRLRRKEVLFARERDPYLRAHGGQRNKAGRAHNKTGGKRGRIPLPRHGGGMLRQDGVSGDCGEGFFRLRYSRVLRRAFAACGNGGGAASYERGNGGVVRLRKEGRNRVCQMSAYGYRFRQRRRV